MKKFDHKIWGWKVVIITLIAFVILLNAESITLKDCIRIATSKNPQVLAAKEEYYSSGAERYRSFANLLPSLKFQGSYTRLDEAPYTVMDPTSIPFLPPDMEPMRIEMGKAEMQKLTLQITEPISARLWTAHSLASINVHKNELNYRKVKLESVLEAIQSYYQLLKAEGFLNVAQISKQQIQAHITDLENMYAQGIIQKKDLLRAKVQESEVELLVLQAQNAVELSKKALCMALGLPLDYEIEIVESLQFIDYSSPIDSVLKWAESYSIDAKLIDLGVKASEKQVKLAWEGLLPEFSAMFNYDYQKPNRQLEMEWYDSWTAVGAVQWNLFDWGGNIADIKSAKHRLKQMEYIRQSARQGIELQARSAYLILDEKRKKLEVARKEKQTAEENFRVTKDMFHNGAATNAELLDAQSDLTRANININNYMADFNIAKVQLKYITGELEKLMNEVLKNERK
ncbi:hypothetical protein DRQ33_06095 [bacterium]|nr:MAG: hypothetical protein DRQ33_06095 [bacterium]